MNTMIIRLIAVHRALNREIAGELKRRLPDSLLLATLKKRRLAVKDRIHLHLANRRVRTALVPVRG